MERSAKMGKVDCFTRDNFSWGWPEFISHNDLFEEDKKFLLNDSIRILWYLEILVEVESSTNRLDFPRMTLGLDLGDLLKTGRNSDITIKSGDGKEYRAHKLIISQRSRYFEAMFSHPTKENNRKEVDLPDPGDIIGLLLEYMYTDRVTNSAAFTEQLLVAADKYQIDNLKKQAEMELINRITVDNVTQFFVMACDYNAEVLKKECKMHIASNLRQVIKTPGWQNLRESEEGFTLATELLDMQMGREVNGDSQESMAWTLSSKEEQISSSV